MNHQVNSLIRGLLLGTALLLAVGCASTRSVDKSDDPTQDAERISGGISAIAGESAGAEATVTSEDAESQPDAFIEGFLQGRVPGVQVMELPGGGFSVRIRGKNSILGSSEPLYVVDGMQVMSARGGLAWLNIHDIEKIEILKNASETAIYGSRGANGVVLVTTKRGSKKP